MTSRRAQLIGYTPGCSIDLDWNGSRVFSGSISWGGDRDNVIALCEWITDVSVIGAVPMQIRCHSGSMAFVNVYVNQFMDGFNEQGMISDFTNFVKYWQLPSVGEQEFLIDCQNLTDQQLQSKYNLDWNILRDYFFAKIVVPAENFMCQPYYDSNYIGSDAKHNININGIPQSRHNVDIWPGPWHWSIGSGETLTCDFQVGIPSAE